MKKLYLYVIIKVVILTVLCLFVLPNYFQIKKLISVSIYFGVMTITTIIEYIIKYKLQN